MLRFHPLIVTDRTVIADDAIALRFDVPSALRDEFRFQSGHHVAIRREVNGQEERRT